jgi:peptide chain release factor subunit 1
MITKAEMEILTLREGTPGRPILSVYLDIDQSRDANRNRKFEVTLSNLLRELGQRFENQHEREEFVADAERVTHFVSGYRPGARSLVILCDASENFLWSRELDAPLRSEARWSVTPYFRPLLEMLDEYERYGVILADRARARLFTIYLGKIEEHGESFAPGEVKTVKRPGRDRIRSDSRFQRKADQYAYRHLKRVAELAVELERRHDFGRLLLAGPVESTSQLQRLLPKHWQSRVFATLDLPVDSDPQTVLAATLRVAEEAERNGESMLVENLISDAARVEQRAVTGLDATLRALRLRRIRRLVYADGVSWPGGRCVNCAMLYEQEPEVCSYCGDAIRPVDDLVEQAAQRVVVSGGETEQVRGGAAERLGGAGGIGAFLKF